MNVGVVLDKYESKLNFLNSISCILAIPNYN